MVGYPMLYLAGRRDAGPIDPCMKKLLLLFLVISSQPILAQIEQDKLLHYGAGVASGAAGAFIAHEISGGNRWWTLTGAVGGSLIAGLAKEAIDKNRYGVWDNGDLAATVAGGVTVGVVIELFRGKNRRGRTNASRSFRGFRVVAGR